MAQRAVISRGLAPICSCHARRTSAVASFQPAKSVVSVRSKLVFTLVATAPQTMHFLLPHGFCCLTRSGAALAHQKPQASTKAATTTSAQATDDAGSS